MGPLLWRRPAPSNADGLAAAVPDYRVIQDGSDVISGKSSVIQRFERRSL